MLATILLILVLIALFALGIVLLTRTVSKTRWLKQHGTRIIAKVTDTIFAAGSSNPKIVIAQWRDPRTEKTYTFRSLMPTTFRMKIGETVDVLVDPDNPERYVVLSTSSTSWRLR